jgi:hypothetical protein
MSGSRFDVLARKLAGKTTRRTALAGAGAGVAALTLGRAVAQEATPVATPVTDEGFELLFIQNAGATTLTPGSGGVHTLTLSGIATQTLYFTNRPARVSGALPTTSFVAGFTAMFSDAPPNAAIIGHATAGAAEEVVVAELTNPALAGDSLTYEITILSAADASAGAFESEPLEALDAPREYAEAHLFIDDAQVAVSADCAAVCAPLKPPAGQLDPMGLGMMYYMQCLIACGSKQ